jgi:hypothetical protein
MIRFRTTWLGGLLLVAVAAVPARAGDSDKFLAPAPVPVPAGAGGIDKFLPEDTEIVVKLNVRQLVDSKLVKKLAADAPKEGLPNQEEIEAILKDLGFDPDKDLDHVILAAPLNPGDDDRGLVVVHGKFDLDKFKKKAETTAKDNADILKIHKSGNHQIYEVNAPTDGADVHCPTRRRCSSAAARITWWTR